MNKGLRAGGEWLVDKGVSEGGGGWAVVCSSGHIYVHLTQSLSDVTQWVVV